MKDLICPECGAPMELRKGKFGIFYGCTQYPDCRGIHSAHQATGEPMGIPANRETIEWRKEAHEAFDKVWKNKEWGMDRKEAYKLMQTIMGLPESKCHIAMFNKEQCQKLINKLKEANL